MQLPKSIISLNLYKNLVFLKPCHFKSDEKQLISINL